MFNLVVVTNDTDDDCDDEKNENSIEIKRNSNNENNENDFNINNSNNNVDFLISERKKISVNSFVNVDKSLINDLPCKSTNQLFQIVVQAGKMFVL